MVTGWSQVVTPGLRWTHLVTLFTIEVTELHNDGLKGLMIITYLRNMVTGWSQVVTFVTG